MFDKRLKYLRQKQNITQKQLADIVKLTQSTIAGYENATKLPTIDTLILLAQYFNVSADYLLGLSNQENNTRNVENNYLNFYKDIQIYYNKLDNSNKALVYDTIMTLLPHLYKIQENNKNTTNKEADDFIENELKAYSLDLDNVNKNAKITNKEKHI